MISFGFSARHWQRIEAGRPITLTTLLRICEALDVRLTTIVAGLDRSEGLNLLAWSRRVGTRLPARGSLENLPNCRYSWPREY